MSGRPPASRALSQSPIRSQERLKPPQGGSYGDGNRPGVRWAPTPWDSRRLVSRSCAANRRWRAGSDSHLWPQSRQVTIGRQRPLEAEDKIMAWPATAPLDLGHQVAMNVHKARQLGLDMPRASRHARSIAANRSRGRQLGTSIVPQHFRFLLGKQCCDVRNSIARLLLYSRELSPLRSAVPNRSVRTLIQTSGREGLFPRSPYATMSPANVVARGRRFIPQPAVPPGNAESCPPGRHAPASTSTTGRSGGTSAGAVPAAPWGEAERPGRRTQAAGQAGQPSRPNPTAHLAGVPKGQQCFVHPCPGRARAPVTAPRESVDMPRSSAREPAGDGGSCRSPPRWRY